VPQETGSKQDEKKKAQKSDSHRLGNQKKDKEFGKRGEKHKTPPTLNEKNTKVKNGFGIEYLRKVLNQKGGHPGNMN